MASTRKPDALLAHVAAKLAAYQLQGRRLTLALSGGVDSVALLDILAQLRASSSFLLSALYVNHGISPGAAAWGRFCADLCAPMAIPLTEVAVCLERRGGDSLEALARKARYRVFAQQSADFMVLAHHLDDQAETVLLQLLRGAGLKGLSAMPESRTPAGGVAILRPLLDISRADIVAYAQTRGLRWIDDESNSNTRFDRNFLRHGVLPLVEQRFPAYRQALLRASRHAAEAAALLDELAAGDGAMALRNGRLDAGVLRSLPPLRAKNLLRWFLDGQGVVMPSALRLAELLRQLNDARPDAQVRVEVGTHELRRYREEIHVLSRRDGTAPEYAVAWDFQDRLEVPGGTLRFEACRGDGISLAKLQAGKCEVRSRAGNDRLRVDCRRPSRSLKNLFQEAGVPPWERRELPLLYCDGDLVWVPGIGINCTFQAEAGEAGVLAKFAPLL